MDAKLLAPTLQFNDPIGLSFGSPSAQQLPTRPPVNVDMSTRR